MPQNNKRLKLNDNKIKEFINSTNKYLDFFGIKNWEITFDHKCNDTSSCAELHWNLEAKQAIFQIAKEMSKYDYHNIDKTAFHEVLELLLADLASLVWNRIVTEEMVSEAKHEIIHTLENTLYPLINKKGKRK